MMTFEKTCGDYSPAEHLSAAREIAEALYLTVPANNEIQAARIVQHLDALTARIRSCDDASSPAVALTS
jgi:hypothetical protein